MRSTDDCWAKSLTASYYSVDSLKKEGTYATSKGKMANGVAFRDDRLTAASWDYRIGTRLRVTNKHNGKTVVVVVTDRTARRFKGKRIDLSVAAMSRIDGVRAGLVPCQVTVLN